MSASSIAGIIDIWHHTQPREVNFSKEEIEIQIFT
jgi:hypothetical protein